MCICVDLLCVYLWVYVSVEKKKWVIFSWVGRRIQSPLETIFWGKIFSGELSRVQISLGQFPGGNFLAGSFWKNPFEGIAFTWSLIVSTLFFFLRTLRHCYTTRSYLMNSFRVWRMYKICWSIFPLIGNQKWKQSLTMLLKDWQNRKIKCRK